MTSHNEILAQFKAGAITMDQLESKLASWAADRFWEQCAIAVAASYDGLHNADNVVAWSFGLADAMLDERNRRLAERRSDA